MSSSIREFFDSLPTISKYILILSGLIPLAMKLMVFPPHLLVWHWDSIIHKFEIWRLVTPFFVTRVNMSFLFSLFFRFQYSAQLETVNFHQRSADYFYFLIISGLLLNALNIYFKTAGMWENFSMVIIYLWVQKNRSTPVTFFFGIRFPAIYLPAVMAAFDFIMDGNALGTLCGIIVGHFWFVLNDVYGLRNPRFRRLLQAPKFLKNWIDKPQAAPKKPTSAEENNNSHSKPDFYAFQGRGRKLGG